MKDKEKQIEEIEYLEHLIIDTIKDNTVAYNQQRRSELVGDVLGFRKRLAENIVRCYKPRIIPEDSVVLSREEWKQIKNSLYYSKETLEKKLAKERKETAEKILHLVGMIPIPRRVSNRYGVGFENALTVVKLEVAKQFGVEIKE